MTATIVVWVLIMFGDTRAAPLVIDNIHSRANCEALAKLVDPNQSTFYLGHRCVAVRKAVTS